VRDRFLAAWRTAAQAGFALALAWLVGRGIDIPPSWSGPVELALIAAGAGVWAAGTHWLQTRTGNTWWAKAARFVGRVAVLGVGALPQYTEPAQQ
jgi:hypothetical protein